MLHGMTQLLILSCSWFAISFMRQFLCLSVTYWLCVQPNGWIAVGSLFMIKYKAPNKNIQFFFLKLCSSSDVSFTMISVRLVSVFICCCWFFLFRWISKGGRWPKAKRWFCIGSVYFEPHCHWLQNVNERKTISFPIRIGLLFSLITLFAAGFFFHSTIWWYRLYEFDVFCIVFFPLAENIISCLHTMHRMRDIANVDSLWSRKLNRN